MRFEVQHALQDLDQATPAYLKGEIFSHGSTQVRQEAITALQTLDPKEGTTRLLADMLRLTP